MACNNQRNWDYLKNHLGDDPCVIAGKVVQPCVGGPGKPGTLTGNQYPPPPAGSSRCVCTAAYYYTIWGTWSANCNNPSTGPYNDPDGILPGYAKQVPSGPDARFEDPQAPPPPPPSTTTTPTPTQPPPTSPRPPPPSSTAVGGGDDDDDVTTSATQTSAVSSTGTTSGVTSTITESSSASTPDDTSTLTPGTTTRSASPPQVTGTAGFSADPNNPNNPSPSLLPIDGSSNSGSGTGALGERKSNVGAVVGGVIGAIAFLILLGGALYWYFTRRRRGRMAPSAAYMAAYGRPETVMSQRPNTDRSTTPLYSMYADAQAPYSDDLRESVHSYNMEGVTGYNGPQRTISPQQHSPTRY
ncbi:hypothetical protein CVT24_011173 [Panaeolus cyanescens]|uniref:Uncharacterized protein n=1 Tax=Panaeolus cyanescens TaxID=181874 RepID=A0A409YGH9_9AGAR|nr:hypothetical protein CVT24_011173 [Panaeolus cyanescens]